jgi:hypothetical protein
MKNLLIIALAFGVFACGSTKESTTDQIKSETKPVETVTEQVDLITTGIVKDMRKTDGCDFVIAVTIDGNETLLEPLELDEQFKVDGKTVKLIYAPSRRQSKCKGTMPIMIEKIK